MEAIPLTSTTNDPSYGAGAAVFPTAYGGEIPFVSGFVIVSGNPAFMSVAIAPGQWTPDVGVSATIIPVGAGRNADGSPVPFYGVRFRDFTAGSHATVFGALFQQQDPSFVPSNQFTGTIASPIVAGAAMTQICDVLLTGSAATWDTQTILGGNIPNTYNHLMGRIVARTDRAAIRDILGFLFNNDSGPNYDNQGLLANGVVAPASENVVNQTAGTLERVPSATATANLFATITFDILNYNSISVHKTLQGLSFEPETPGVGAGINMETFGSLWHPAAPVALTRIIIASETGANIIAGSRFTLYGLL